MFRPTEISASAPTVNDDFANGFREGIYWFDTTTGSLYICVSDVTGAADWDEVNTGGAYVWADWTPSFAFTPATPTTPTYVARYMQIGNIVHFYFDLDGSNDSGSTLATIAMSPPIEIADTNTYPTYSAAANEASRVSVPIRLVIGLVDAESAASRKLYITGLAVNNAADYRVTGQGFYEMKP